jgi:predicted nucleic acid-binding protein
VTAPHNAAEFWNVCARPATARGGLGLSVADADQRLRVIERLFPILPVTRASYAIWRQLVVACAIMGVQVHDARLVAFMSAHGLAQLLTLNAADFARCAAVVAHTPAAVPTTAP